MVMSLPNVFEDGKKEQKKNSLLIKNESKTDKPKLAFKDIDVQFIVVDLDN